MVTKTNSQIKSDNQVTPVCLHYTPTTHTHRLVVENDFQHITGNIDPHVFSKLQLCSSLGIDHFKMDGSSLSRNSLKNTQKIHSRVLKRQLEKCVYPKRVNESLNKQFRKMGFGDYISFREIGRRVDVKASDEMQENCQNL